MGVQKNISEVGVVVMMMVVMMMVMMMMMMMMTRFSNYGACLALPCRELQPIRASA